MERLPAMSISRRWSPMADPRRALLGLAAAACMGVAAPSVIAQEAAPAEEAAIPDNAEMAQIFADDQAARMGGDIDWEVVRREDAARAARTREMLDAGELRTGNDFWEAAFIFQHGGEAEDYLLAHVMAVHAVSLGSERARWIAAATLDRYLQETGQDQIYGTQFRPGPEGGLTMEPYDRELLPDFIRERARVPVLAEQEAQRLEMEAEMRAVMGTGTPAN